jgi:hypothetical protein
MTIETKFNTGDEVWFLYAPDGKAMTGIVTHEDVLSLKIQAGENLQHILFIGKGYVFKTKEELIESLFN